MHAWGIENTILNAVDVEEFADQERWAALDASSVRHHGIRAKDAVRIPVTETTVSPAATGVSRSPGLGEEFEHTFLVDCVVNVTVDDM